VTSSTLELLSHGPFARIMLTNFFFFGALNGFLLLPLYIQRLGGDEADIGLVQGLYSAAGIVCQPVVGALIDYLGRRFFMRFGALLLVVSCALFVVASPLPLLGVLRILQGVAFSAFFVANYVHVVEMVPVERRGWALPGRRRPRVSVPGDVGAVDGRDAGAPPRQRGGHLQLGDPRRELVRRHRLRLRGARAWVRGDVERPHRAADRRLRPEYPAARGLCPAGTGVRPRVLSGGAVDLPRRRADTDSHDAAWEAR
jgi:hypothetical protein